jgi:uncharacterized protein (DUF488 family)
MARELFTIGHSNHTIGRFLALLSSHGIDLLCDVRSTPYSRFNPQFNREPLNAALAARNIAYLFLGNMLGGKPRDRDYPADGRARFALIAGSERFRAGLARLLEETKRRRTAIMCAEKDPAHCHRGLLICPNIPAGVAIHHILADGSIRDHVGIAAQEQEEDAGQQSLF